MDKQMVEGIVFINIISSFNQYLPNVESLFAG